MGAIRCREAARQRLLGSRHESAGRNANEPTSSVVTRNPLGRPDGWWERRAASLPAKAATGAMFLSGGCGPGSPAYQGWHAGTVIRDNSRGPHASRPDLQPGNPAYKANAEVAGDGFCSGGVGGEHMSVDRRDNTTRWEQRLLASAALAGVRERPTLVPEG